MAITASNIIRRALRLLGVVDAETSMEAIDAADSLDTLNAMLAEWHAAGIGLPDYSIDTLETELATDAADKEAIAYSLALRLAPEYGIQLPAEFATVAQQSMFRLRSRYWQAPHPVVVDYY